MQIKLSIYRPQDFWLAAREDFPDIEHPAKISSPNRRRIHDVRSWDAIVRVATTVGARLQQGGFAADFGPSTTFEVSAEGLDGDARKVLEAWFSHRKDPVVGDTWMRKPVSGRHRLGYSWLESPSALLPVASSTLRWRDYLPMAPDLATTLVPAARCGVTLVPASVASRNPAFMNQLEALGRYDSSQI